MGVKYTDEELHDASKRVMKSLGGTSIKPTKLAKPAIKNTLGKADDRISKSARKRRNRQLRASLAGSKMENLLDMVPVVEEPPPPPKTAAEAKEAEVAEAVKKQHSSRRAEQKIMKHEIHSFGAKSLDEIRANIMKMSGK